MDIIPFMIKIIGLNNILAYFTIYLVTFKSQPSSQFVWFSNISLQQHVLEDQHVSISSQQTCGNEGTASLVVDRIIKVSEVTCETFESSDDYEKKLSHNMISETYHGLQTNKEKGDDNLGSQSEWNGNNPDAQ